MFIIITAKAGREKDEPWAGVLGCLQPAPALLPASAQHRVVKPRSTRPLASSFLSQAQALRCGASWPDDTDAMAGEAGSGPGEELSCAPSTQPLSPGRIRVLGSRNYSPQKALATAYRVLYVTLFARRTGGRLDSASLQNNDSFEVHINTQSISYYDNVKEPSVASS